MKLICKALYAIKITILNKEIDYIKFLNEDKFYIFSANFNSYVHFVFNSIKNMSYKYSLINLYKLSYNNFCFENSYQTQKRINDFIKNYKKLNIIHKNNSSWMDTFILEF